MLKFSDLAQLEINHPEVTIRRYQETDFAGLEAIFERDFSLGFLLIIKVVRNLLLRKWPILPKIV